MPDRPTQGLFVSATDTGAGKTFVTCALARLWRRRGLPFRVCKPVATGAERRAGRWVGDDTLALAEAAGDDDLRAITPWAFPVPAAPPVAARHAGARLSLGDLAGAVRRRASEGHAVLVEGVGGLLCPLTERETVADLVKMLGLPLVVVARRSLGTLNHTLLTAEVARVRGLGLAGVVVSETAPPCGVAEESNVEELRARLDVPVLAVVPHGAAPEGAESALAHVDWWALAGCGEPGRNRFAPGRA
jgi:dethiobiotin synthetase